MPKVFPLSWAKGNPRSDYCRSRIAPRASGVRLPRCAAGSPSGCGQRAPGVLPMTSANRSMARVPAVLTIRSYRFGGFA
jgi:hypothetical protein